MVLVGCVRFFHQSPNMNKRLFRDGRGPSDLVEEDNWQVGGLDFQAFQGSC